MPRRTEHHIYRIDATAPGTPYWVAQVAHLGKTFRKTFYDIRHGGKRIALIAARSWRDAVLDRVDPDAVNAHLRVVVRRNTRSGIPGVARFEPQDRGPFWTAYWQEPGIGRRSAKFSVRVHGEETAKARAIAARRAALRRLGLGEKVREGRLRPDRRR